MKILLVDDSRTIRNIQKNTLKTLGHTDITEAADGLEALACIAKERPDLMLVDWNMPNMDGITLIKKVRETDKALPIIMVTSRDYNEDKIKGLEIGADDYMTKPFSPNELAARVKAALRRSTMNTEVIEPTVQVGELFVDFISNRVMLANREVLLSDTEYRLLCYLARNAGRIVTRDQILERIWGEEYSGEDHLLHVTIGRLRQKLEDPARKPKYILTRRGIGYSFPIEDDYVGFGSRLA